MEKRHVHYEEDIGDWESVVHHRNRTSKNQVQKMRREGHAEKSLQAPRRRAKLERLSWSEE